MENKINIAELLKDCPQGMELDCTICNNRVTLEGVVGNGSTYPIRVIGKDGFHHMLTCSGGVYDNKDAKCVIFPKGKTTWEGFQRPFKDGDIIFTHIKNYNFISIFTQFNRNMCYTYIDLNIDNNDFFIDTRCLCKIEEINIVRLATEEEKEKLFDAIKAHGYKWNEETKTLEKLPKFKVGDRIRKMGETSTYTITDVNNAHYFCGKYVICDTCDNDWELVPNKFDITTLKVFDKVLVRDSNKGMWSASIFSHTWKNKYICIGIWYNQCIPYEENKHLLGTTDDCDEYYKTWE